jgi:predicted SnoaL-like aldol condensation-catalyzing enzyme
MLDVIRRMYDAANTRDLDAIDGIFARDFRSHPMGTVGSEHVRAAWRHIMERYPDFRVEPVEMIANGDRVAVWSRVHVGEGEPETLMELIRVADDRVAELWGLSSRTWR